MSAAAVVATAVGIWFALDHSAEQCKADLLKAKFERQRQLQEQFRKSQPTEPETGAPAATTTPGARSPGQGSFGDVFNPENLKGRAGPGGESSAPAQPQKPGQGAFGDVFNPQNLKERAGPGGAPTAPAQQQKPGQGAFGDVFNPDNLKSQSGTGDAPAAPSE